MTKLRPYLAIDIETTGLNVEKSQILQIAWVIDDGVSPLKDLERGNFLIHNKEISYGENYALGMNAWIFQELMKPVTERKYTTLNLDGGIREFLKAGRKCSELAREFDLKEGKTNAKASVQLAGKNVANFDWPVIANNIKQLDSGRVKYEGSPNPYWEDSYIDHRFIDCGAVFFQDFGKNPSFKEINKLIGWKDITHDAIDDAINVVVALRFKAGIPL